MWDVGSVTAGKSRNRNKGSEDIRTGQPAKIWITLQGPVRPMQVL